MAEQLNLQTEAVDVVRATFGNDTATLFAEYSLNKNAQDILSALEDILKEHLGEKKAKEVTDELYIRSQTL
jgi:hypothetical protein